MNIIYTTKKDLINYKLKYYSKLNIEIIKHLKNLEIENPETLKIDVSVIKKQYKKLALKYHPDKSSENIDKFLSIKNSYEYLINYYFN